jgi:drug/metabolite transporter (DMT)-like permease
MAAVLAAALLHAAWNALVKAGGDRFAVLALTIGLPVFALVPLAFLVPAPAPESWPYIAASGLIHWLYFACLLGAYRHGDLSQVYPIARGTAPLLVALGAWLAAGETLNGQELAGIAILSGGLMALAWRNGAARSAAESSALLLALATSVTIGAYSLVDGLGARAAGSAAGYIVWVFLAIDTPFLAYALWRRRGRWRAAFGPSLKAGLGGALISSTAYAIAIWAMSVAPMAHVVALRETSVVMAAAIGALFLGEPFGRRRIAAAAVVAAGAALLQLG